MDATMADERQPFDAVLGALRWLVIVTGAASAAPVVATLLLRQFSVDWPMAVAYVAATPFVTFAGLASILLFLIVRCWSGVAIATALTVVLLLTQVPMYLGAAAPDGPTIELTVMTANLHFGLGDADDIVDAVRRFDVDVLALEELTPDAVTSLRSAGLDDLLVTSIAAPAVDASGNGLWSRHPLDPVAPPLGFGHPPVAATMDLAGQPVFVAVVHPVSPYPENARLWSAELDRLEEWLARVEGPGVVAGDFNATPDHRQFRDVLATGFRDAAEQVGTGFLPTYPAGRRRIPLLITIDHVLASGGIVATELSRISIGGTDHEALVAVLTVPDHGLIAVDR